MISVGKILKRFIPRPGIQGLDPVLWAMLDRIVPQAVAIDIVGTSRLVPPRPEVMQAIREYRKLKGLE